MKNQNLTLSNQELRAAIEHATGVCKDFVPTSDLRQTFDAHLKALLDVEKRRAESVIADDDDAQV